MHLLYIHLSRNVESVTECGEHLLISATTTKRAQDQQERNKNLLGRD